MAWRSFLSVFRRGTELVVRVDHLLADIPGPFEFTSNRGCPIDAEVVARHLRSTFEKLVGEARDEAYRAGYRDGRAKRAIAGRVHYVRLGRDVP